MYLALLVILALLLVYLTLKKKYSYWTERGVKQRKQIYLLGDIARFVLRQESFMELMKSIYNSFPEERYVGMYRILTPALFVRDPELMKQIAVKDFDYFTDHKTFVPDGIDELWSRNLISLKGNKWRDMRSTMTPTFTTSKMKMIFNLVSDCAREFNEYFLELASRNVVDLELRDICTRYANDVIATVVYGVKCNSLTEKENEFYMMGKAATDFAGFRSNLKFLFFLMLPKLCKELKISLFPKEVSCFFKRIVKESISVRERNGISRPDVLHLLMEARKGRQQLNENETLFDNGFATVEESNMFSEDNKIIREKITDIDIAAQALIFLFGGFETVSNLMCFLGHELAVHLDIQRRLQAEIDTTLIECNGVLTYESLLKMKYMDMVISETLRKWPVAVATDRVCTKPYVIHPVKTSEKPVFLNEGDIVFFSMAGLHYDPGYFSEPERFDPERFNDENKYNIKPCTYFPFGIGPRNCIGARFALLVTKTLFFHLLSKFDLVVTEKTQIPLKLSKKSLHLLAEHGFWIGLKLRGVSVDD